ncbi:hypothetical protein OROMI_015442 [Orobanche minor]
MGTCVGGKFGGSRKKRSRKRRKALKRRLHFHLIDLWIELNKFPSDPNIQVKVKRVLKPGGLYILVEHVAAKGNGPQFKTRMPPLEGYEDCRCRCHSSYPRLMERCFNEEGELLLRIFPESDPIDIEQILEDGVK